LRLLKGNQNHEMVREERVELSTFGSGGRSPKEGRKPKMGCWLAAIDVDSDLAQRVALKG
jgi:hypothetical protein